MYDDMLVPTDGSEEAKRAFEHALELAEAHGGAIHLLYVVEPVPVPDIGTDAITEAMEATGNRAVAALAERADSNGIEATTATRTGTPQHEIRRYIENTGIDLVVMATHGRTGLDRYLLGSVTENVVRTSPAPVLTVRGEDRDPP